MTFSWPRRMTSASTARERRRVADAIHRCAARRRTRASAAISKSSCGSYSPDVRIMREMKVPVRAVIGTPEVARAFGDISAVPTLFVFDRAGKTASVFYGAPPSLHADAEKTIDRVVSPERKKTQDSGLRTQDQSAP